MTGEKDEGFSFLTYGMVNDQKLEDNQHKWHNPQYAFWGLNPCNVRGCLRPIWWLRPYSK